MTATSLLLVCLVAKAAVLWGRAIPWSASTAIAYVWEDVAFALGFAGVMWLLGRNGRRAHMPSVLYWACVLYIALNVPIGIVLSTPLTWSMVRATSGTLADSILLYATWRTASLVLVTIAVAAFAPRLLGHVPKPARITALAVATVIVCLGPSAAARVDTLGLHRNVVLALAATALPRTVEGAALEDWATPPFGESAADDMTHLHGLAAGRNVVLVGLESTGARYLRLYGGAHDVTPHLDRLAQRGIVFDTAYAVYPESIKGLFSILCSTYPAFDTPAELHERAPCRSIADVLKRAGYATALFHSGRFAYLGMQSIITNRGFDTLEDAGDIGGNHESSFGVDEPSTVSRMLQWIDRRDKDRPFFLHYMPIAGHHPYETPEPGPFPATDESGRYLNALHYADQSLGALVSGLEQRGLDQQTLFVVLGDHGEAFGQHQGNYGHTFFLYDENVRVPFVIAAPGLVTRSQRSRTLVSLVDTAPTIIDLLGLPAVTEHQGQSALHGRSRMALFFTDYSLGLLGLRDGPWKYVYELDSRRSKLFDLDRDPDEKADVSAESPARIAAYERAVRAWSAAQTRLVRGRE